MGVIEEWSYVEGSELLPVLVKGIVVKLSELFWILLSRSDDMDGQHTIAVSH